MIIIKNNEQISTQKRPITIANVRGPDSSALMKYGKDTRQITDTKNFATGNGQLKTQYESEVLFTSPEFSIGNSI